MNMLSARHATLITWLIVLIPPLILLAPALRPGYMMLPAQLPFQVDPLWQPLTPPDLIPANPVLSDQFYQYHAWQSALRRSLAQGEIAWWTPAINGGQPLVGNGQVGLLDPFNLIGLLFPLTASYVVGALLRLWVAGGFTYLYARTIGLSRPAAWLSLLTFSLSGLLVHWLGATPSHVLVWLPALLWAGERLLITRRLFWVLIAAILVAALLFSSQPEIALQVGLAWGMYLLMRAAWLEGSLWRGLQCHAGAWLVIALLGLALAAVEILPFVDALRQSVVLAHRATQPDLGTVAWLQHILLDWRAWPTIITTFLPHFLGREQDESYWYPLGNSIENNAYAGVLPLLLALLALWAAWRRPTGQTRHWVWLWAALGVGALALALQWPIVKVLNDLPPFSLIEEGRWRSIYVFAVAMLAGFGLDLLLTQPDLQRPLRLFLTGAAMINLLLVAAAYVGFTLFADQLIASGRAFMEANAGSPVLDRPLAELYALVETRQQAKIAMLLPSNPIMLLPLWVAGATGVILWLHHKGHLTTAWLVSALLAVTWLDLHWTGMGVNAAAPVALLDATPPAITFLRGQPGPFRVVGTQLNLNPNTAMLHELEDVRGYDPLAVNRYQALLAGIDGYVASGYHTYFRHVDDPRLDRVNATYALSRTPPAPSNGTRWEALFADPSGVTVYRSRSALPRAYMVYAAEVANSPDDARTRTLDPNFDAEQRVVLETMPPGWTASTSPPADAPTVEIGQRGANSLDLAVTTPSPGILVLLETYTPGWRATVDQQPTPIYTANYAFRAIVLPAGQHSVRFTYAPPSLPLALAISGAAWVIVLGLLVWCHREHLPQTNHMWTVIPTKEESPLCSEWTLEGDSSVYPEAGAAREGQTAPNGHPLGARNDTSVQRAGTPQRYRP